VIGGRAPNVLTHPGFVVMDKLGIRVAWSVDSDFSHRLAAVPGPIA
jgi:hypothetical protein